MKIINRMFLAVIISITLLTSVKSQETMYIYKGGAVVGGYKLAEVDSVIFYKEVSGVNTVIDIDENIYNTVVIGSQTWMVENLRTTKYNDGEEIANITDANEWRLLPTSAFRWYNNDEYAYKNSYGALYNWYTVDTDKLCPSGWHVPSDEEWQILEKTLGMSASEANSLGNRGTTEGKVLKATTGWEYNGNGTDNYGFSALGGSCCGHDTGNFNDVGVLGFWWSSTGNSSDEAYIRILQYNENTVVRATYNRSYGLSVRCIKD